jgi:hypothetical protein
MAWWLLLILIILILGAIGFFTWLIWWLVTRDGDDDCRNNGCAGGQACVEAADGSYQCMTGQQCASNSTVVCVSPQVCDNSSGSWQCVDATCGGSTYGTCPGELECGKQGGVYQCLESCGTVLGYCDPGLTCAPTSADQNSFSCVSANQCIGYNSGPCPTGSGSCVRQQNGTYACQKCIPTSASYCANSQVCDMSGSTPACVPYTCASGGQAGSNFGSCPSGTTCYFDAQFGTNSCQKTCGGAESGVCPVGQACGKNSYGVFTCQDPVCSDEQQITPPYYTCQRQSDGSYTLVPAVCGSSPGSCPQGLTGNQQTEQCPNGLINQECVSIPGGGFRCQPLNCQVAKGVSNNAVCGIVSDENKYCEAQSNGGYLTSSFTDPQSGYYAYPPGYSYPNKLIQFISFSPEDCQNIGLAYDSAIGVVTNTGQPCVMFQVSNPSDNYITGFYLTDQNSFIRYSASDFPYKSSSSVTSVATTEEQCQQSCQSLTSLPCQVYTYQLSGTSSGVNCWLNRLNTTNFPGGIFYAKYPEPNIADSSYTSFSDIINTPQIVINLPQVTSEQECGNICDAYPGCQAFTFYPSSSQCALRQMTKSSDWTLSLVVDGKTMSYPGYYVPLSSLGSSTIYNFASGSSASFCAQQATPGSWSQYQASTGLCQWGFTASGSNKSGLFPPT